jgi:tetratricopeptide (TPR) repeat protein
VEETVANAIPEEFDFVEHSGDTMADPVEQTAVEQPPSFEVVEEPPSSPDPFELVDLDDAPPEEVEIEQREEETTVEAMAGPPSDLVDFELPDESRLLPEVDRHTTPLSGIEFADLELEDTPFTAPSRDHDLALPGQLPVTPEEVAVVAGPSPASAAAADDARAAAEEAADIVADVAAREAAQVSVASIPSTPATVEGESPSAPPDDDAHTALDLIGADPDPDSNDNLPEDFLTNPPGFGQRPTPEEHAFPPLFGLAEASVTPEDDAAVSAEPAMEPAEIEQALEPVVPQTYVPTPVRGTISIGTPDGHLRRRLELDPENYDLRRQLGEALLDTGDRDGGLQELELAMVGFELGGDLDRAQEVVDEILRVQPASVLHHQKRVEYAVRSRDRGRLTSSYLELADALFRSGSGGKAAAVYGRVLELDPGNERAEFALATLAPEQLAALRDGPARPERWSDELNAIRNDGVTRQADPPAETATTTPASDQVAVATPPEVAPLPSLPPPGTPIDGIELPNPDWGDGVPTPASTLFAKETSPESTPEEAAGGPATDDTDSPASESGEVALEEAVELVEAADTTSAEQDEHSQTVAVPDEIVEEPPPPARPSPSPAVTPLGQPRVPTPRAATPIEPHRTPTPRSPTPVVPPRVPTPRAPTPVGPTPVHTPRVATPGAPSRMPTPLHVTPATVARITPRPEIPVSADADFVDLGDWLRETEPTRSTRMQVESPKPTGDEQADFEELLRRFKRGVAENVEAEDYDAHYDLGVAYKEMGLVDEAIAQFQKALRGPEHRVRSYEALGQCFVEKQQYPIAAALLQRATEVPGSDDQQLVGVLYLLGFATEHLGRPAEALAYYLRVFAVDIEFRDIAARVAAMGNLTK